jgi:beta-hydroxylase
MEKHFEWPQGEKVIFVRPPVEQYNGKLANFYKPECFPEITFLKTNWGVIRDEVLEYERREGNLEIMSSKSPAKTKGAKWSLMYFRSFNREFNKNKKLFPKTVEIMEKIPNCVLYSISILPPNIEIAPHYGDTNGIIRCHLGVIVPEPYPAIGIKVGEEEMGWKEGELLCFVNVQKHNVWNKSSKRRYIVMFDIVPQNLSNKKDEICIKGLASQTFIYFYKNYLFFRIFPEIINKGIVKAFEFIWYIWLPIEKKLKLL